MRTHHALLRNLLLVFYLYVPALLRSFDKRDRDDEVGGQK
jgi:hypothetical protein